MQYFKSNIFYEQLLLEYENISKVIISLENENRRYPDGKLLCIKNGNYQKWLVSNHSQIDYIPKGEIDYIKSLAKKQLNQMDIDDLLWEAKLLKYCINEYEKHMDLSTKNAKKALQFSDLLNRDDVSSFHSKQNNPLHPETLIHKTFAGHYVRSKSEVIIANTLYANHIHYEYEKELLLDDCIFYPDFTIYPEHKIEQVYWEHFGLIELASYRTNMLHKIDIYGSHDILPPNKLIMTFETKTAPLDSREVQHIINNRFAHS